MRFNRIVRALCLILALSLAVCGLAACGDSAAEKVTVKIHCGDVDKTVEIETGKTVKDALDAAKITLGEKDECTPKPDEKITADTKEITVIRAAQVKVSLTVDGKTNEITTTAATVQELLDEQKITLGEFDEISEKTDAQLTEGMELVIKRVEYKEEVKNEEIAFETEQQTDESMAQGESEVTQQGVKGEKEVTYKVKYVDGVEESREKVSEKVTKEPVKQIVTVGAGSDGGDNSGDGGEESSDGRKVVSRVPMPDCDEDGHGSYIVTYDDGSVEIEKY